MAVLENDEPPVEVEPAPAKAKSPWRRYLDNPEVKRGLIQFALNASQPRGPGQSQLGHLTSAVAAGGEAIGRERTRVADEAAAAADLDISQRQVAVGEGTLAVNQATLAANIEARAEDRELRWNTAVAELENKTESLNKELLMDVFGRLYDSVTIYNEAERDAALMEGRLPVLREYPSSEDIQLAYFDLKRVAGQDAPFISPEEVSAYASAVIAGTHDVAKISAQLTPEQALQLRLEIERQLNAGPLTADPIVTAPGAAAGGGGGVVTEQSVQADYDQIVRDLTVNGRVPGEAPTPEEVNAFIGERYDLEEANRLLAAGAAEVEPVPGPDADAPGPEGKPEVPAVAPAPPPKGVVVPIPEEVIRDAPANRLLDDIRVEGEGNPVESEEFLRRAARLVKLKRATVTDVFNFVRFQLLSGRKYTAEDGRADEQKISRIANEISMAIEELNRN